MSKKISKNVMSANDIAKWDVTLDDCVFVTSQQGPIFTVQIGNRNYAGFVKKADCDAYVASLNAAISPVKELISAQYASDQLVILSAP